MKPTNLHSPHSTLQFLKLGGSLITDKNRPHTLRPRVLARLAEEIAAARVTDPSLRLVVGHGSGSFGHIPAKKHSTRQGVDTREGWQGFVEVWRQASALYRLVMEALSEAGLPAIGFSPSASVTADDGQVVTWNLEPLRAALDANLIPVIHGDVVFDTTRGGTILSTEDLFAHLARHLRPRRILLAGVEDGVWADYPICKKLIPEITPANLPGVVASLGGSTATDVTGGMASKVRQSLTLTQEIPGLEVLIFSGDIPGLVQKALLGESVGTILRSSHQ